MKTTRTRNRRPAATDSRKAVAYVRVSTDRQDIGPEAQRAALAEWAEREGVEIVATFEDKGVSGGASIENRPGLLAAIDALAEHGAGALAVAKRDRLARDVIIGAMVERMAERHGARIVSADGTGNGDGPEAMLMRRMVDAFAEYERSVIRARTKAALAAKKARGERAGSIPFGYRLADDGRMLDADPAEQAIVEKVRALRADGLTYRAIADKLASAGILPRKGSRWYPPQVARMCA